MTIVRAVVLARLRTQLQTALAAESTTVGVQVINDPATEFPAEWVHVAVDGRGEITRPSMKPSGTWDDRWQMIITLTANVPGKTMTDAELRSEQIANVLVAWLRPNYALSTPIPIDGLVSVVCTQIEGPFTGSFTNQEQGYGATIIIRLEGHARLC